MMSSAPPPPPPSDSYIVLGRDRKQYPVELVELRTWAIEGRITAAHQVFSRARGQWLVAGELPELRDVFEGRSSISFGYGPERKSTRFGLLDRSISPGWGCAVVIAVAVVILLLINGGRSTSRTQAVPADTPPSNQIGNGTPRTSEITSSDGYYEEVFQPTGAALEILRVVVKYSGQATSEYARYVWKADVANNMGATRRANVSIQLLDADGFQVGTPIHAIRHMQPGTDSVSGDMNISDRDGKPVKAKISVTDWEF